MLELLLFPPGGPLLVMAFGLLLAARYPPLGLICVALGLLVLYLASIPVTALALMRHLQTYPALLDLDLAAADKQAIVIVGAGRYRGAPEYGGDTVSRLVLERLRYGAWLHRKTNLPILSAGGKRFPEDRPEAELMREVLVQEFHVPVRWIEDQSRTTFENAQFTRKVLEPEGIRRIFLISHAWHLPRAVAAFRQAGFVVTPAPTAFVLPRRYEKGLCGWIPRPGALVATVFALHELVGTYWYRLRHG
jgi:Uncharacterized conserved protein